jgi:hypothetical protein
VVISSCLLEVVGVDRVWIMVCVSNPRLLKSCVLCLCGSPCNCDSDGRLDCFRSPVVVAVDVVRCVGEASTVSVAVPPIVVELPGLVQSYLFQSPGCCIAGHCISFSRGLPLSSRGPSMYVRSVYHVGRRRVGVGCQ